MPRLPRAATQAPSRARSLARRESARPTALKPGLSEMERTITRLSTRAATRLHLPVLLRRRLLSGASSLPPLNSSPPHLLNSSTGSTKTPDHRRLVDVVGGCVGPLLLKGSHGREIIIKSKLGENRKSETHVRWGDIGLYRGSIFSTNFISSLSASGCPMAVDPFVVVLTKKGRGC